MRARTQFDIIETTQPIRQGNNVTTANVEESEEEELAFNLFAPTTNPASTGNGAAAPVVEQKIRIRSPTPLGDGNPGFIIPHRPQSYYSTGSLSAQKAAEYAQVAVLGTTIEDDWAKRPCPGCAYSWKVISVPASAVKNSAATLNAAEEKFLPDEERERRKKRLGKKARIKQRVKAEKLRTKKEEAEKGKEEKEKLDREKRARRNREKKFKKRARDKAKKAAGGIIAGGEEGDGGDSGSGDEGSDVEDGE